MSQVELVEQGEGQFQLKGQLNRDTVVSLPASPEAFWQQDSVSIDLGALEHTDTAGLAWLLALVAESREQKTELTYQSVPELLLKLAKISDVDRLLPLQ
ncbi:hypothetical protein HMF8227_02502 [Saliniradius amylolyticus]|uniref:STAS domain-containing protein n=1 Tax=Saliniradius amylolyticus TaxID=2183582 RepID=A0A2S2E5M0_9ALTE|nr:STAS domain-containing protein [Saliniradius amylolyticus]AWL12954.1 hypothetical protein HMF8227_02502 [Saliniradius amylolyticus]